MDLQPFAPYLSIAVIILAVVITALVLMQAKGSDLSGFLGGGDTGGFRTKRGVEASMHRLTIYFSVAFFLITFLAFLAWGLMGV